MPDRVLTAERSVPLLALLAAALGLIWLVHPWYDATNDGSMYIACARALLDGEGYSYLGEPFRIRPPGFAVILAGVLALRGTDFLALNLLVSVFGLVAVALLYVLERRRLGWGLALAAAVFVWLNPGWQRSCTQVMSDVPGVALMLAALLLERWATTRPRACPGRETALGIAIALAVYVRSLNILLIPAILCARIASRLFGKEAEPEPVKRFFFMRLVLFAVVAWLGSVPWSIRDASIDTQPPADQTYIWDYSTGMWHTDPGDPSSPEKTLADLTDRSRHRLDQFRAVLGSRMVSIVPRHAWQVAAGDVSRAENPEPGIAGLAFAIALVAASVIALVRRRATSDFLAVGMLVALTVYFGFDDRLLLPYWVLAVPAALYGVRDLLRKLGAERAAAGALPLVVVIWGLTELHPRRDWDGIESQHLYYAEQAAALAEQLDPEARLGALCGWHWSVYLERKVWSLEFAVRRAQKVDAVEEVVDKYDLDTVLLSPRTPVDSRYMPWFEQRYSQAARVVDEVTVVRVRE